jgi:hypothetical protein
LLLLGGSLLCSDAQNQPPDCCNDGDHRNHYSPDLGRGGRGHCEVSRSIVILRGACSILGRGVSRSSIAGTTRRSGLASFRPGPPSATHFSHGDRDYKRGVRPGATAQQRRSPVQLGRQRVKFRCRRTPDPPPTSRVTIDTAPPLVRVNPMPAHPCRYSLRVTDCQCRCSASDL